MWQKNKFECQLAKILGVRVHQSSRNQKHKNGLFWKRNEKEKKIEECAEFLWPFSMSKFGFTNSIFGDKKCIKE